MLTAPSLPEQIGPYRILRLLAIGGMAQILLAHDEGLDRPVAIKRLRPDGRLSPERRERIRREARLAAKLDHPAIVRIYELLDDGGSKGEGDDGTGAECIVMPYIEGPTLRKVVEPGPMPVRFVLDMGLMIADALSLAHELGVVHRDLKSENVILTPEGLPKITDFGVAKHLLAEDDEPLTQTSALLGTCRTMAPEQAQGKKVDHRCDLFSFGVLLYEALTGISPFEHRNDLMTLEWLTTRPHDPLDAVAPGLPASLGELVDDCLEKSADDRPQTADELVVRLVRTVQELGCDASAVPALARLGPRLEALLMQSSNQ